MLSIDEACEELSRIRKDLVTLGYPQLANDIEYVEMSLWVRSSKLKKGLESMNERIKNLMRRGGE